MNGKIKSGLLSGTPLGGRFLAVDFDSWQLRLVQVALGISGPSLRKLRCADIPSDVDTKSPQQMGAFLAQTIRSEGLSKLPLVMNVPRSQAVLKPLHLPPGTQHDEIAGMVKFQVQGDIPFPPEETVLDFTIEGELHNGAGQAGLNVLAAAVQTSTVEYYRDLATAGGFKLIRLGLRSYANACCAEACDALKPNQTTAIVHITADETQIDVLEGHNMVFSRAAAVKISPASVADPHARRDNIDGVISETIRSLQSYAALRPEGAVNRILVAGGTGIEPEVVEILGQMEQYHCILFNPAETEKLRKKNLPNATSLISAIGLAYGSRSDQKLPFDFLHPKQPVVKRDPKLARRNAVALTGLLLMIIFIVGSWLYLDSKANVIARLKREKTRSQDKQKKLKRFITRVNKIDSWDEKRIDWLDQWANISSVMPDVKEIYIDDLKTTTPSKTLTVETSTGKTIQRKPKGAFALTVRAHDDEEITKLVNKLQEAGYIPETKKDGEYLQNPFGYTRYAEMIIYIPADMEIDVASLKKHKRPQNDDLKIPLKEIEKSAKGTK